MNAQTTEAVLVALKAMDKLEASLDALGFHLDGKLSLMHTGHGYVVATIVPTDTDEWEATPEQDQR